MKFAFSVPDWVPHWRSYFPIVDVLGKYKRRDLSHDLFAGLVVSVITVPQAIAYAFLAGLPPQAGLYASIVPPLLYAALGSSPSLAVGPVAVIAIMVAEAVRAHASAFSDAYLGVTAVICLEAAITLWLLRLTQMGGIVNLLSHPVISGFINAAAIMIILSQLTALTGIPAIDGSPFAQARHLVTDISALNPVDSRNRMRELRAAVADAALRLLSGAAVPAPRRAQSSDHALRTDAGRGRRDRRRRRVRARSALRGRHDRTDSRRAAGVRVAAVRPGAVDRRDAGVGDDRFGRLRAEFLDRHTTRATQTATPESESGADRARRRRFRRGVHRRHAGRRQLCRDRPAADARR